MHDAFVAGWTSKYAHYVQRPITFIRNHLDPTFTPLFLTPAHPSYTSGHATSSHAAAAVLAARLGDIRVTDTSRADDERGLAPRTFDTFEQAAAEAAISRVFAGIHYRFDADAGEAQGDCVGSHVAALDVGY